ncbi:MULTISPECIES: hypothetical protein [unclassified Xanthomonas]|uniref:hypothetical protein n=1 Tax=unclassified Xanthomonas TaxID=2643310 RepID=UPI002882F12C|nr:MULTISPECIES: hypothetical protein [unclassified Xanthomonas]
MNESLGVIAGNTSVERKLGDELGHACAAGSLGFLRTYPDKGVSFLLLGRLQLCCHRLRSANGSVRANDIVAEEFQKDERCDK